MQRQRKLDQNLIFGEFHNEAGIKTFISTHMNQFYQQGYRILVGELNEDLPIGDLIDDSLKPGSSLKVLMQKAHELVMKNDPAALSLLDEIEAGIKTGPWLVQGSDKASFALLVKSALANKMQVRLFDYIDNPGKKESGSARVTSYDDDVTLKLQSLNEKWLDLCGNDHVVGLVTRLGRGVVGFQRDVLNTALTNGTVRSIQDLEQVQSIPS